MNIARMSKKLLVIPVAAALTLGGLSLATSANADPNDLTATNSVSGRVLTVTGTATAGEDVALLNSDRMFAQTRQRVDASGTYKFVFEDKGTSTDPQKFSVIQTDNLTFDGEVPFTVTFAAPFALTSPADGSTVASRTVTFSGTGHAGDLVNVLNSDNGRAAPQVLVGSDGKWTTTGTFSATANITQALSVNQIQGGAGRGNIAFTITLPAAATPAEPGAGSGVTPADPGAPTTGTPTTGAPTTAAPTADQALPVVSG